MVGDVSTIQGQQVDPRMQAEMRRRQMALFDQMSGIASGTQMGAGEMAAQRGTNRAIAQQQAMAAMARGGNAGIAQRAAARGAADIGVMGAGQMAQARSADQQAAMAMLGQGLGQARGQDIGMATTNAQLMQQANLANMDAENQKVFQQAGLDQSTSLANMESRLRMIGMNDQAALQYLSLLFNMDLAEMQARLEQDKISVAGYQPSRWPDLIMGGGQAAASAAMMSDERLKTRVKSGDATIQELLDLPAHEYEYKEPRKDGHGKHVSLMAQDLERTVLGKSMVSETPRGKQVNYGKAFGALLAGMTQLNRRVKTLEK